MQQIKRVIVIGGPVSLVQGNFGRKLKEHGIIVEWHVPDDQAKVASEIPNAAEGMIIVRDHVGHRQSTVSLGLARSQNLPVVIVSKKWRQAEEQLRVHGFIPLEEKPTMAIPIRDAVLEYSLECRKTNRIQGYMETQAFLQERFADPTINLTMVDYKYGQNKAAEMLPFVREVPQEVIEVKPEEVVEPKAPAPSDHLTTNDRQAVTDISIEVAIMFRDSLAALLIPIETRLANIEKRLNQIELPSKEIYDLRTEIRAIRGDIP